MKKKARSHDLITAAGKKSLGLINVKSKSFQLLNESEVGCYSQSSSIQLSHFSESLKRLLIAINLQQQQHCLLL